MAEINDCHLPDHLTIERQVDTMMRPWAKEVLSEMKKDGVVQEI